MPQRIIPNLSFDTEEAARVRHFGVWQASSLQVIRAT
jgi:hypothetical protein